MLVIIENARGAAGGRGVRPGGARCALMDCLSSPCESI